MPDSQKENIGLKDADYADPAIADKVSQHLNLLEGEEIVTPEPESEPAGESEPTPSPKVKTAGEGEPTPEPGPEPATELPDNHYRAALHQGWTAEEVSDFLKSDSEKALKTFERIYKSTNELSRRFAQLGEAALKVQQPQPEAKPIVQIPQVQDFVDMKKIREEYSDNPLVDMIGTLNEGLKKVLAQRQEQPQPQTVVQSQVDRARYEEDMAIAQQLQYFFGDDDMKSYDDFYGASLDESGKILMTVDHLTPGQQANRMAAIRLADRILAGSELQGETMPVAEALELAHLVITEKIREKAIRDGLTAKVVKQGKGLTLRPTGSKKDESGGPPKTEDELVERTKARMEKLLK
jgi:hypothetical protein